MAAIKATVLAVMAVVLLAIFCTGEDVVGVTCPEHYVSMHGKCLLFVMDVMPWDSANVFCKDVGAELATHLDDCPLFEELLLYIESYNDLRSSHFWVGGTDVEVEGVWKWTNGDRINMGPLYWGQNAGVSQPQGGADWNCIYMAKEDRHRFHDYTCSSGGGASFICQTQPIVKDELPILTNN